jgi:hypothetical protein
MNKNTPRVKELLQIGMEDAAQWMPDGKKLKHVGDSAPHWRYLTAIPNSLYAFACEGEVLYIGKTTKTLSKRFVGYCDPGNGRATNWKCHQAIKKLLHKGKSVRILVLPQNFPLKWGDYPINLAAGLEDALVEAFKPQWNGSNKKFLTESQLIEEFTATNQPMQKP